ncbi:hypothetical protein M4S82_10970 [Planococcus sp. MERTA32b]|nr:hypothetical protein [Planococcus sp. MER TA 32b]
MKDGREAFRGHLFWFSNLIRGFSLAKSFLLGFAGERRRLVFGFIGDFLAFISDSHDLLKITIQPN